MESRSSQHDVYRSVSCGDDTGGRALGRLSGGAASDGGTGGDAGREVVGPSSVVVGVVLMVQ